MIDPRSNWITVSKWGVIWSIGYFMLHPICGIYEKSDYRDVIFMLSLVGASMGLEVPITFLRRAAWKEEVKEALNTEPPKQSP